MIIESSNIVKDPVVSVIVLTYNHHNYLRPCLESILEQNLDVTFELIIGDDCSQDDTREICLEYQKKYPNVIRLLFQESNKGVSGNYADLLSLARANYIAQIAGDDFWYIPNKLQMQYDYMVAHPKCGLCYTNAYTCDAEGHIRTKCFLDENHLPHCFEEHLLNAGTIAPLTWMFTKELANHYQDNHYADESFAMALEAYANFEVNYLPVVTSVYRQHSDSLSSFVTPTQFYKQYKGVFESQIEFAGKYNLGDNKMNQLLSSGYINFLSGALLVNDEAFLKAAKMFFEKHDVSFSPVLEMAKRYNDVCAERDNVRSSKAYCIGKILLKPFKFFRR